MTPIRGLASLRSTDVFPVVASLPFGGREATTGNTSALRRLRFCSPFIVLQALPENVLQIYKVTITLLLASGFSKKAQNNMRYTNLKVRLIPRRTFVC